MINGSDTDIYIITTMEDVPPPIGRQRKWPFDRMLVGNGFDFPVREIQNVRAAKTYWCSVAGKGEEYRIWVHNASIGKCKRVK